MCGDGCVRRVLEIESGVCLSMVNPGDTVFYNGKGMVVFRKSGVFGLTGFERGSNDSVLCRTLEGYNRETGVFETDKVKPFSFETSAGLVSFADRYMEEAGR